ncbi:MAG: alpha-amylase family glycosyl hydrolase [Trueperaceae bacterium]
MNTVSRRCADRVPDRREGTELEVSVAPLAVPGPPRELHLSRAARKRYSVEESLFGIRGNVLFADVDAARTLADRMNELRDARRFPELAVRAGELFAAGLLHELQHLLITVQRELARERDPVVDALNRAEEELGAERLTVLLTRFAETFPTVAVERGGQVPAEYLASETDGVANREVVFEEMLLLWLANDNPALERFRELFDDAPLRADDAYPALFSEAARHDAAHESGVAGPPLLELLQAPSLSHPTSLEGQLEYARVNWRPLLGERIGNLLDRLLLGVDLLAEERKAGVPGSAEEAPVLGLEDLRGPGGPEEYERFSPDASWMPSLVLLAKSSYVWLDQLSRRYERDITTLDAIPDEELDELAARGFSGLWLIGLWERSEASRRIKHLRGQPDAVASAYALYDYRIADDLGGESAFDDLRERAWQRGIRLASDMVPNHVGIDGRWVIESPDWFVQTAHSPYPGYTFNGPDLSLDARVGVFLEDHYYDNTDAAVVFKRVDRETGEVRFIYHGNDGTAMPWNDTAQLDYLKPEVREAVIETILGVARRFPVIRFDAAMTLAKQHIQRLWYPEPGRGGAIPSRAQNGSMSAAEFERMIPREFWREVVDRVASEVPGTLLLAEAFWMMEGYFVRTLGMHRVYNSAFMNMLKREANAEFRQFVKNVLEFDPEVLGRFVNFMNNPDEDTAVAQFGKGDKYFGVCTVMATMPGLPMFGHGQVEGFEEKYGMEYRRARRQELPDPWLIERHQREIFPLLHRRAHFADADGFLFYDFLTEDGSVAEDVLAYSNLVDGNASLVLFHNSYAEVRGRLNMSVPYSSREEGGGRVSRRRTLFEGIGLDGGPGRYLVFRDHGSGLEHLAPSDEVRERGMEADLAAFQYRVLVDFREVTDSASEPYADLCRELAGRGVPSVHDAVSDLLLRPLFDVFGDLLDTPLAETEALLASYRDFLSALDRHDFEWEVSRRDAERAFEELLGAYAAHRGVSEAVDSRMLPLEIALLAWMALAPLGGRVLGRFRLEQELAAGQHSSAEPYRAILFAELMPMLLEFAPLAARTPAATELLAQLLADSRAEEFLRIDSHEGQGYFDREAYRVLTDAVTLAGSLLQMTQLDLSEGLANRLARLRLLEEESGYRWASLKEAGTVSPVRGKRRRAGARSGE